MFRTRTQVLRSFILMACISAVAVGQQPAPTHPLSRQQAGLLLETTKKKGKPDSITAPVAETMGLGHQVVPAVDIQEFDDVRFLAAISLEGKEFLGFGVFIDGRRELWEIFVTDAGEIDRVIHAVKGRGIARVRPADCIADIDGCATVITREKQWWLDWVAAGATLPARPLN
jgi:hypothetical protein